MIKRLHLWLTVAFLTFIICMGGVFAAFQYSLATPEEKTADIFGLLSEFNYDGTGGSDMDEKCQVVVDIALGEDGGGLNGMDSFKGFKGSITLVWVYNRTKYGYVGSMDVWWGKQFGTPDDVSFIVSHPDGDGTIYLYIAGISQTELNAKNKGDILTNVYRVKIIKNSDDTYEQAECKKGFSPVTLYENTNGNDINGFAIYDGTVVWQEN